MCNLILKGAESVSGLGSPEFYIVTIVGLEVDHLILLGDSDRGCGFVLASKVDG